ncbi:MAG: DUF697 domain-containing protein [Capsulimonadales bacterium]|nr:DUF697 domain-containing protein [Capsulimonadales bacterium]
MERENIPFYLKKLGETVENRVTEAIRGKETDSEKSNAPMPPMRGDNQEFMEPDWDDLDRKADLIIVRYTAVSAVMNILPMPFDVMGVTGTFTKMATELAGVYQVIVSNKRARQMGWAIATTTASVLGIAYAGSKLAKMLPGGYWIATAAQAPLVGAIAWAAGDALKNYFKQCRQGREPSVASLSESFAQTLRIRLKKASPEKTVATAAEAAPTTAAGTVTGPMAVGDVVEKIAGLHELLRAGAITQEDFDRKKAELLSKL